MPRNLTTIPPTEPFARSLAEGLWRSVDGDPFALSRMLVLLPTRRACRTVRDAFLACGSGAAVMPPRLSPLGDLDEDEWVFGDGLGLALPPAISPLRRQHKLASLIRDDDPDIPLEQALLLAEALGRFLDEVLIEGVDLSRLPRLVDRLDLAEHWQHTVRFLDILTQRWPAILAAEDCIDAADRRNRVLRMQAALWQRNPPDFPVIAAGSTGTLPATAELLAVIADLPQGRVILPGLDHGMDETSWQDCDASHPQYGMKQLLDGWGLLRTDVGLWGGMAPSAHPRGQLLTEAMRPPSTTDQWRSLAESPVAASLASAMDGLQVAEFDQAEDEAAAIAILFRQALTVPDRKAVLVTPDRELAARVAAQMQRWDVTVNDSAGCSLATVPAASFLLHILDAAQPKARFLDHLTLLKHPLAALGQARASTLALVRHHEIQWRGGMGRDVAERCPDYIAELVPLLAPMTAEWAQRKSLLQWIDLHLSVARAVAANDTVGGDEILWMQEEGEAVAAWFEQWRGVASDFPSVTGYDYAQILRNLLQQAKFRPAYGQHPRLAILGLLEARMVEADLVILGGVNEGIWPPAPPVDPWLSRPMRQELGLPSPDRRIGLAAHDFVQLAAQPRVVVTYARRRGGVPAVPSRFVLQLHTVMEALGISTANMLDYLQDWHNRLDRPQLVQPCAPPAPCPPLAWRPQRLPVTKITTWQRNPYAIYAQYVLHLAPLDPLVSSLDASERGTLIHAILERFIDQHRHSWPHDALQRLLDLAQQEFSGITHDRANVALFWPRFEKIARLFVAGEAEDRARGIRPLSLETKAIWTYGDFTLSGQVDRIDRLPDGGLRITDYKTGAKPNKSEVESLLEPQLPLLAMMARDGCFADAAGQPEQLRYQKISGGQGKKLDEDVYMADIDALIDQAADLLRRLIAAYADPARPYLAVPIPAQKPRYDDYAHLARMAEWGRFAEDSGGD